MAACSVRQTRRKPQNMGSERQRVAVLLAVDGSLTPAEVGT